MSIIKENRVLFYAPYLPIQTCGTTVHSLQLLKAMYNKLPYNVEMDICIDLRVADKYKIKESCVGAKVFGLSELEGIYDIAYMPYHMYTGDSVSLAVLDKHSNKWIMWILDSIYLMYEREDSIRKAHALAKQCVDSLDGIVFSSKSAKDDFIDKFPECEDINRKVLHISPIVGNYAYNKSDNYNLKLPYDSFVLVMGNAYKHKMIPETIDIIKNTNTNYIVVGTKEEKRLYNNVYCYPSGSLTDEMMKNLYARCDLLVFPSVYEGFGLPVVEALNFGKEVIAYNHDINHELELLCDGFKGHIHYYNEPQEIVAIVDDILSGKYFLEPNLYQRTWEDVAKDVIDVIQEVSQKPVDEHRIARRHFGYDLMDVSLYYRHKTLVNIVGADYDRLRCDKVIDIYGAGINGMICYKHIKRCLKVGCFIEKRKRQLDMQVECIPLDEYSYCDNHIIVVTPEYDIETIKNEFLCRDSRFEDIIIGVSAFLDTYVSE